MSNEPAPNRASHIIAPGLQVFVFALFFIFGGITSLNDVLIPKLKGLFTLTYRDVMLVQTAFFLAYFLVSLPAASLVSKWGYLRTAVAGLCIMMAGCLLFVPAATSATFGMFLTALFVLASGITIVQVVANPLICMLGPPSTAHSRLTFAQAFNSLGTTLFPYFGSILILGSLAPGSGDSTLATPASQTEQISHVIDTAYCALAAIIGVVAFVVWSQRKRLHEAHDPHINPLHAAGLLRRPRFAAGVASIFFYVGAEVAIGSLIVNYLMQHDVLGLTAEAAGKHVPLYWGGAMLGRFIGAYLLRIFSPGKVLAAFAAGVIGLLLVSAQTAGAVSAYSLLAIGLFNSIMFPTIFSLASEGLGKRASEGSGIICMAIVGGAVVPLMTGHIADVWTLKAALLIPALCYAAILAYGVFTRRSVEAEQTEFAQ